MGIIFTDKDLSLEERRNKLTLIKKYAIELSEMYNNGLSIKIDKIEINASARFKNCNITIIETNL